MHLFELPLIEVRQETPTVSSFLFDRSRHSFDYVPGQFVRMHLNIDGNQEDRSFSISSSPTEPLVMITMRHSDKPFKQLLSQKKKGDLISFSPPQGKFLLDTNPSKKLLFIAGGIGITPFRSMLTFLHHTNSPLPVTLLHSSRTEEEIIFKEELESLAQNFSPFSLTHTITRSTTWAGKKGRITKEDLEISPTDKENTLVYICGLPRMVIDMVTILRALKVPSDNTRFELFTGY